MPGATIAPHRAIQSGELIADSTPTATDPGAGVKAPDVVMVQASKEDIQDYVAELFGHNEHVSIEAVYDDNNNIIQLTATATGAVVTPTDISDAITALDGAIN